MIDRPRLVALPGYADRQRPDVRFCGHCGQPPVEVDIQPASRVCERCGLGLMLAAAAAAAPSPDDPFLLVDWPAVDLRGQQARGGPAADAPRRSGQPPHHRAPAAGRHRGRRPRVAGEPDRPRRPRRGRDARRRPAPADEYGIRFWARIGPCGPPRAALMVLGDGSSIRPTSRPSAPAAGLLPLHAYARAAIVADVARARAKARYIVHGRDPHERRRGDARREPEHAALLGAALRLPAAAAHAGGHRQFDWPRSRRCARRSRRRRTSRRRSRSRASAATARRRRAPALARSRASTRTRPTACSRRASPSARSSARSRRCCCPASSRSPTTGPAAARVRRSPGAGRPAGWPRSSGSRRRRRATEARAVFDASRPCDVDALHAQALELVPPPRAGCAR